MKTTINPIRLSSLERQCLGNNLINRYTKGSIKKALPQLTKFLNKKIRLSNGKDSNILKIDLLKIPFNEVLGLSHRTYIYTDNHSLRLFNDITIKNQEYSGGGYGVTYYKRDIILGQIKEGVLIEIEQENNIITFFNLNKQYNSKKISKVKSDIEKLELKINQLKKELF